MYCTFPSSFALLTQSGILRGLSRQYTVKAVHLITFSTDADHNICQSYWVGVVQTQCFENSNLFDTRIFYSRLFTHKLNKPLDELESNIMICQLVAWYCVSEWTLQIV